MNDKENYPTTPGPKRPLEVSEAHENSASPLRNLLKPVSPTKSTVASGRLSILQSDNLDAHLAHIHNTQEDIQVQLQRLETQTAQTGLDLGQLVDRLKNNNLYLNKLLEGISAKADTITRDDVEEILNKIDVAASQAAAEVTEAAVATTAAVKASVGGAAREAAREVAASTADTRSLPAVVVPAGLHDSIEQIEDISRKLSAQNQALCDVLSKERTAAELEAKIAGLQLKYDQLCDVYQRKYKSLKELKEEFQELQEQSSSVEALSLTGGLHNSRDRIARLQKLNQLSLGGSGLAHPQSAGAAIGEIRDYKRVVSTPVKRVSES